MFQDDAYQTHTHAQPGDLAQLVSPNNKVFIVRLAPGGQLQTHRGILRYDDLIGLPWGSQVYSHKGSSFFLLQPSLSDLLRETRRTTQIMYPKEIGFLLVTMGIGPGVHVLEAGTGSGALTTALSWAVGPQGHVTTYEVRADTQALARKNLERLGLADRVTFKVGDIADGFAERGVDALFLDVHNPYDYIQQARQALKTGGYFGSIQPTTNQVSKLLTALFQNSFAFVDVCEIMLRYYKPVPERLRPTDRMVAHTGYLIFGRPMLPGVRPAPAEGLLAEESEPIDEAEQAPDC
ncbi:MAG TPA: tRNA (adenine-N1)-methyltransferase [Anaerolineales bacterium]